MGYAIFAARKLQLTARISALNFRIMALSQQQQSLASVSSSLQQYFSQLGMGMSGDFNNPIFNLSGNFQGDEAALSGYRDAMVLQGQYINSLSQVIMKPVALQENQIEQERKRLETQLKAADAELKQVEEAENKQIEKSAPKFA